MFKQQVSVYSGSGHVKKNQFWYEACDMSDHFIYHWCEY